MVHKVDATCPLVDALFPPSWQHSFGCLEAWVLPRGLPTVMIHKIHSIRAIVTATFPACRMDTGSLSVMLDFRSRDGVLRRQGDSCCCHGAQHDIRTNMTWWHDVILRRHQPLPLLYSQISQTLCLLTSDNKQPQNGSWSPQSGLSV